MSEYSLGVVILSSSEVASEGYRIQPRLSGPTGQLSDKQVAWLIEQPPFRPMCSTDSLRSQMAELLREHARWLELSEGDVVFRKGQYGDAAYLILAGEVRISLSALLPTRASRRYRLRTWWTNFRRRPPRSRGEDASANGGSGKADVEAAARFGYRTRQDQTQIFLQDVPGVISRYATHQLQAGDMFGEMAAVTRSAREYTAFAGSPCRLLELRWQGLRLLRKDPAFRQAMDERYRASYLTSQLRETELFRFVPEEHMRHIVSATRLESFGELEWYADFQRDKPLPSASRIEAEPLIAAEGDQAIALWIIRAGFGRRSQRQGAGHRTTAYLGKGHVFGLEELVHNARQNSLSPALPYQESLRAIGHVDMLCIPKRIVVEHVLPFIRRSELPRPIAHPRYRSGQPVLDAELQDNERDLDTGLLEFVVENRLINGKQAMVIDNLRCTRCDDCVRACAATHGGEPLFVREGPQHDRWMFPQACMHCQDPVCMIGCPTGAIHRNSESGLIEIHEATCIGCKSCAESCPYHAIRMVESRDQQGRAKLDTASGLPVLLASKCDLCVSNSGRPACQAACPHDALFRIDLSDTRALADRVRRVGG
ncbi:MAG: 4Fe-4S dicluster domain-containing protein [bacterium]|nr:4Fe-4S dicluster domain-containing protein [bacterium]